MSVMSPMKRRCGNGSKRISVGDAMIWSARAEATFFAMSSTVSVCRLGRWVSRNRLALTMARDEVGDAVLTYRR